jgi:large subunit ribosomal protein L3
MVEAAAEHEVHDEVSPERQAELLKEQQAGAGDDTTPAVGQENTEAEGNAPDADENKEG